MLSPGIDAMTWNPRDSMYPWMFSLMRSPHIFLNLINQPRGGMVMEMYCGLPFSCSSTRTSHSSAVDVTDQPHSSGQQPCPASSADCQPVQLTPEDSSHPAQHVYSRRRLHFVSQGKTTPEDQQSSPVASLPSRFLRFWIPLSGRNLSFFLSRWRILVLSYELFSPKHRAYLMSVQSSHEPESFAEAFNHSCWRDAMQEEINAQERKKRIRLSLIACGETSHWLQSKSCPYFNLTWRMPFNNIREGGFARISFYSASSNPRLLFS